MTKTLAERFWEKVDKSGPIPLARPELGQCWLWTACGTSAGYGTISVGPAKSRKMMQAHRVSLQLAGVVIPDGMEPDHLCFVKACVRPSHLEPVTHQENSRRSRARITQCPKGHPYDEANTHIGVRGERRCRKCVNGYRPERYERNRDAILADIREYRLANRDAINARARERYRLRREAAA